MVKRIEALADCIGKLNKVHDPESDAYQLRNPGLFRAYTFKHIGQTDAQGRRKFTSMIGGYRFLVQDLEWKCSGQTRAKGSAGKLKPTSSLVELLRALKVSRDEQVFEGVDFLQNALHDITINAETPLNYFLGDSDARTEN